MTKEYIKVLIESPTEGKIAEKVEVFVLGPRSASRARNDDGPEWSEAAGFGPRTFPDGVMWECFLPMFRITDRGGTKEEAMRNISATLGVYLHSEMKSGLSYDQTRRPLKRWQRLAILACMGLASLGTERKV